MCDLSVWMEDFKCLILIWIEGFMGLTTMFGWRTSSVLSYCLDGGLQVCYLNVWMEDFNV